MSDSEEEEVKMLFSSALDVGSSFLTIEDEDELIFRYKEDRSGIEAKLKIVNVTPKALVAFYVCPTINIKRYGLQLKMDMSSHQIRDLLDLVKKLSSLWHSQMG
jgi:hypothetical protein